MKLKKNIVNNFHLLTENQRLPYKLGQRLYNMLGQRFYYMSGQRLYNMLGQRLYNMLGHRFLDEQSADGFALRNQRWPNENCSVRPNVGPTSNFYLGPYQVSSKSIKWFWRRSRKCKCLTDDGRQTDDGRRTPDDA